MVPSVAPPPFHLNQTPSHRSLAFSVLLVGSTPDFADRCQDVVEPTGADVLACGIESFMTVATRWRPPVIVVPEALFDRDPTRFHDIANAVGATLIRLRGEPKSREGLDEELMPAVFEAMRRWERRTMN